jgi:hypothetical protein
MSRLQEKLRTILEKHPPSSVALKKVSFYHADIKPFLQKIAPKNCYYGRLPNDEKLFGYWRKSLLL